MKPVGFSPLDPALCSTLDLASLVHEQDSGYSDVNPAGQQSLSKRKRVRESGAMVQDASEDILRKTRRCRATDRERARVHTMNDALENLRRALHFDGANGKLTKVEILRSAVKYTNNLMTLIDQHDREVQHRRSSPPAGFSSNSPPTTTTITTSNHSGPTRLSGIPGQGANGFFVPNYGHFGHYIPPSNTSFGHMNTSQGMYSFAAEMIPSCIYSVPQGMSQQPNLF